MNLEVILSLLRSKLFYFLFLGLVFTTQAQTEYVTGTALDDATYDFHEQFDITQYTISLPQVYSMNQFVPKVGNQLKFPHDIGWSVATATTIVDAVYSGDFNKENTISELRSPYFINMLWSDELNPCKESMSLSRSIDKLRDTGIPKLQNYVDLCPSGLDSLVIELANDQDKYRYEKVFNRDASNEEKTYRIKTKIALDRPVIMAFHCPPSFVSAKDFWSPKEKMNEDFPLHSVVVVGYDDELYGGSFQILNSWSKRWGNDGLMWVRYDDMNFVRYAYSVGYNEGARGETLSIIKGELSFQDAITGKALSFNRFNPRGFYEFSVGAEDLQFNLKGNVSKPFYIKMYYKNGDEIVRIYPMDSWRSSLFEYSYMGFEIPGEGNYYTIEEDLFSSIYVFISLKNIDKIDFEELVRNSETIYDVLFSENHTFSREVIWDNDRTNFYARLYDQEIIPLLIGLEFK